MIQRSIFLLSIFALFTSTAVQASVVGRYNSEEKAYEITYDDLVEELSMKKQRRPAEPKEENLRFAEIQIGYSLSSFVFDLPTRDTSLAMSGAEFRVLANSSSSNWNFAAGLKNYARASASERSVENKILSTQVNRQDLWRDGIYSVFGIGLSGHFIHAQDLNQKFNRSMTSLDITGGIRGKISQEISWGVDLSAYSPLSSGLLKGGVATSFLLTSNL